MLTDKIASVLRSVGGRTDPRSCFNTALIVAAGVGSRMGDTGGVTKQLIELDGVPVVARTLSVFQSCDFIDEIIVVGREEELALYAEFKEKYGLSKLVSAVKGGATRRESVLCGLREISDKSKYIAIHDAARCLITPKMIYNVLCDTIKYGAAAAAERTTDTLKQCDENGFITQTLDRSVIWRAQTPQCFKTSMYLASAYSQDAKDDSVTDDCMLAERLGFRVKLVDCGRENMKITTPEDIGIALALLRARRERAEKDAAEKEARAAEKRVRRQAAKK